MRACIFLVSLLLASPSWSAVSYPTSPTAVDYSVSAALCTMSVTTNTQLQNYFNKTAGAGCGGATGPQRGDTINLAPGVTFTDPGTLPVAGGSTNNGDWVTIQTNPSGSTCPSAGTRAIDTNDPVGTEIGVARTSNVANLATLTASTNNPVISAGQDNISHYRFVCLRITGASISGYGSPVLIASMPDGSQHYPDTTKYPDHISFERVIVAPAHDFGAEAGIRMSGSDTRVVDSIVTNIISNFTGDANGINFACGPGPGLIQNNDIGAMGENVFLGAGPQNGCGVIEAGYQYSQPANIDVQGNLFYRLLSWKRDHATYNPQTDLAGTGTVSSSGTTLTFGGGGSCPAVGKWVRGLTSGAAVKISSGSGSSCTAASTPNPAFSAESWRYNTADLSAKNLLETKGSNIVRAMYNMFYQAWKDGQPTDLQITPREYGWVSDWEVAHNAFLYTPGPGLYGVGDYENGAGFGPSPFSGARFWVHDNLWMRVATTALETFIDTTGNYGGYINAFSGLFGQITTTYNSVTITAGATSGSTTFTASSSVFAPEMAGTGSNICIVYNNVSDTIILKATITAYTNPTHVTGTITTCNGCDTLAHTAEKWAIGKCSLVGTAYYQADSVVIEHNGWSVDPSLSLYKTPWLFEGYQAGITQNKVTNLVFRSNYAMNGGQPNNNSGGVNSDNGAAGYGTGVLSAFADASTLIYGNNVLYGAQTLTGNNASHYYTAGPPNLLSCVGPNSFSTTCKTAFHEPDQAGGSGTSTSMGFTDFASGGTANNLLLTGTYATAAHDGTMIGPDTSVVYRRGSFAYQGVPFNSTGQLAVSGSSGVKAVAGNGGIAASLGCVRGVIAAFDSGC